VSEGRVLAASQDGAYVLRLTGDVRMTLCTSIDDYLEHMLADPAFASVWIDLCDVEGIDSTTLGQLAQLALRVRERYGFRPAIYCCDPGINRLLRSMGFERLFDMQEKTCCNSGAARDIPLVPGSEEAVRDRVIEAHRVLMGLSEDNAERFRDLVEVLESRS
jgi:anti-anti-sigma factor